MFMQLVIVESPTKSRSLQRFLGSNYKVLASFGHVRDLPEDEFGIEVEKDFKPKYLIIPKVKKVIRILKDNVQKAELTTLAMDPDREGEAIAWHLTQILNLNGEKPYQRIVFHEITKSAIEEALKNPRKIDLNLVDAQQARRVLDRIVGYKLSPFLWKKVARGLSAGRVQSVAVRLAVEREREIQNFVPQEYWTIVALLLKNRASITELLKEAKVRKRMRSSFDYGSESKNIRSSLPFVATRAGEEENEVLFASQKLKIKNNEFEAILVKKDEKTIPKLGIKTKEEAEKIVKDLEGAEVDESSSHLHAALPSAACVYKVINVEKKELKRNPLPPFTTSTLQQEAWKRFHFPAKMTMQIAQQLYETGKITYHRTDSLNLSDLSLFAARKFIIKNYGKNYWAGFLRKYKAKGRVQEAHEAIRPTYPEKVPETTKLDKNQLKLYDLIWRRFLACQMAQAAFDSTAVEIEAEIPNSKWGPAEGWEGGGRVGVQIPKYTFRASGQILKFDGFLKVYPMKFEETELPPLEKDEVLELIKLIPSQHFTQPPPRYTEATLIKALEEKDIGRPSTYAPILSTIQERNYIEKDERRFFRPTEIGTVVNDLLVAHFSEIVDINFTAKMEEDLDNIAQGQKNWIPVIKEFYSPFEENLKKKYQEVSKKDITEIPTEKICPKCGAPLLIRLGKFGRFYACSRFPKCKYTESLEENTLGIKCPKCKKGEIVEKRTKKRKIFYGCSNWPNCDFALWDKPTGEKCPKCGSLLVETKRKQIKCSNPKCDFKK